MSGLRKGGGSSSPLVVLGFVLALGLVGCGGQSEVRGESCTIFVHGGSLLPRGGMDADIEGTLTTRGACVLLQSSWSDIAFPVIWPAGTSIVGEYPLTLQLPSGEELAVGQVVSGGGGMLHASSGEVNVGIPAECLPESGEVAVFNPDGDLSVVQPDDQPEIGEVADESIEGRWVLESWLENGRRITVEVGVNTPSEPWIEFTKTFEGARDSFISADSTGTAGIFVGSTGCNDIRETGYEFSVGFLVLEEAVVQTVECPLGRAEEVVLAMLWSTPDGIEAVVGVGQMELFGSNLHGTVYPLLLRRDG